MDKNCGSSQSENELNIEYDGVPVQETKGNLKPDLQNHDNILITLENKSQDIREESQSSQQYEVNKNDTYLSTAPVDYETITELQNKPNINYILALDPPVNNQELSLELSNLKHQSITIENVDCETTRDEKQLITRYIDTPKELTFPQYLNVYCNPVINMEESQFQDKESRHRFIRRVEVVHFFILMFTLAGVAVFDFGLRPGPPNNWIRNMLNESEKQKDLYDVFDDDDNEPFVFLILCYIGLSVLIFISLCFGCMYFVAKLFPANIIYMFFFVLFEIICFGSFDVFYYPYAALIGVIITMIVIFLIAVISKQSKWDITSCSFIIFIGLTAFGLAAAYFVIIWLTKKRKQFYILYTGIVVAVYCMLNLFITQIIMAYKKYEISTENVLPAAVLFYFMDFGRYVNAI